MRAPLARSFCDGGGQSGNSHGSRHGSGPPASPLCAERGALEVGGAAGGAAAAVRRAEEPLSAAGSAAIGASLSAPGVEANAIGDGFDTDVCASAPRTAPAAVAGRWGGFGGAADS